MKRELLLGCGNNKKKQVHFAEIGEAWEGLTTLDMDASCGPDVVHDLNVVALPFADNEFDEIHAYEVLEHCGRQGDWRFFFDQFTEFHRILKPGGYLVASCPMWDSPWAWSDPGHTRVISKHSLAFLRQAEYASQVGNTAMTDYRSYYKADFETIAVQETEHNFAFVLRAIK
jgi:SAM-dependent methyltransferase